MRKESLSAQVDYFFKNHQQKKTDTLKETTQKVTSRLSRLQRRRGMKPGHRGSVGQSAWIIKLQSTISENTETIISKVVQFVRKQTQITLKSACKKALSRTKHRGKLGSSGTWSQGNSQDARSTGRRKSAIGGTLFGQPGDPTRHPRANLNLDQPTALECHVTPRSG